MAKKKKQWNVKAEYGCVVDVIVEASSIEEAEKVALPELDEAAMQHLSIRDLEAKEV